MRRGIYGGRVRWWQDEYGYTREWIVFIAWIVVAAAVIAGICWGMTWLLDHWHTCSSPYHLVYTGTRPELVGKVVVPVDQYACEAN